MWSGDLEKWMEFRKAEIEKKALKAWMWGDESSKKTFFQRLISVRMGNRNAKMPSQPK
ncbi:MAG: hypothetical protein K0S39_1820 [Paenibacillus sp.]|jgi:hypothetical protein|nr:hypothetical protein [Paenibacillus sp.]